MGTIMDAKGAIHSALVSTQYLLSSYVSDLSDADLLVRPVPAANHIAWQLGHLIVSEGELLKDEVRMPYPELPAGFVEQHKSARAALEPPTGFSTKEEYLALFNKARGATLAILAAIPEADLDKPTSGPMAKIAPTLAALFLLQSNHTLMHAGQFTVVRRKLGKPVLF